MKNSEQNYFLEHGIKTQEPCYKRTFNKVVLFAKQKPIIFAIICISILAVVIIIIASIAGSKNKNEGSKNENGGSKNENDNICSNRYSDECLYSKMIAKQKEYPEGMRWTNDNSYTWKGGIYSSGRGCAGFAFMLSDVCFDEIQAEKKSPCPNTFKVGDVVRINNDTHSVIILKIDTSTNTITIAEGNFNSSVHWGRTFTIENLKNTCKFVLRRYPL